MFQHTAYLSLGSNIGDKQKNLNNAITLLNEFSKIDVVKVSSFYKTQPQNFTDQDWFVNAAVQMVLQCYLLVFWEVREDLFSRIPEKQEAGKQEG